MLSFQAARTDGGAGASISSSLFWTDAEKVAFMEDEMEAHPVSASEQRRKGELREHLAKTVQRAGLIRPPP